MVLHTLVMVVLYFSEFGVGIVHVWCMCGVLLVWMDVSWAVFVVCTVCVLVYSCCMMCACFSCEA